MAVHRVTKSLTFAYGHRLQSHDGPCVHPHGHNARVEIDCEGPLDEQGMVVDFREVERALKGWIHENWDHRMILQRGDPLAAALRDLGEPFFEMDADPTAENLAREIFRAGRDAGLPVVCVRFWESPNSMASYSE